jgi:hypothetical protein
MQGKNDIGAYLDDESEPITEKLVLTSSATYVKIVSGTIALSPRYFSQATRATLITPAKDLD